ncbi:MAG TPA: hypothetical protein VFF06_30745 [Polyangia bacterium]|nr:hypothetical protein [Polyangia bacterium]
MCSASSGRADAQTVVHINMIGGGERDVKVEDITHASPDNPTDSHPIGETTITANPTVTQNPDQSLTVNIKVSVTVNKSRLGKPYTVQEPNDCEGMTFKMNKDWVQAHELQHVKQMQDIALTSASDAAAAGKDVKGAVTQTLADFQRQEGFEYGYADQNGSFPDAATIAKKFPGAQHFDGIEKQARDASCADRIDGFDRTIADIAYHVDGAGKSGQSARTHAQNALQAANDMKTCDAEAYAKAKAKWESEKADAQSSLKDAHDNVDEAKQHVQELKDLLKGTTIARRNGATTDPKGASTLQRMQAALDAAEASVTAAENALNDTETAVKKILADADAAAAASEAWRKEHCNDGKAPGKDTPKSLRNAGRFGLGFGLGGAFRVGGDDPPSQAVLEPGFDYRAWARDQVAIDVTARLPLEVAGSWTNFGVLAGVRAAFLPWPSVPIELVPAVELGLVVFHFDAGDACRTLDCTPVGFRFHPSLNLAYRFLPSWEARLQVLGVDVDVSSISLSPRLTFGGGVVWRR